MLQGFPGLGLQWKINPGVNSTSATRAPTPTRDR